MEQLTSLGLIGGGQMGEALVRGLLQARTLEAEKIIIAEPAAKRRDYLQKTYSISLGQNARNFCENCSTIIVAVKPQIMATVLDGYKEYITSKHLVISIAAGISLNFIEDRLEQNVPVIRVMPNTPALVLAGASAFSLNQAAGDSDRATVTSILKAVGSCVELPENQLDAVTGLSGSGPGYVFTLIEAMIDGGVREGLPRDVAEELTLQTFLGSTKLAMETKEHPAVLRGRVTSPGGTTIAGLHVLEEAGVRGSIMSAVRAATARSRELS